MVIRNSDVEVVPFCFNFCFHFQENLKIASASASVSASASMLPDNYNKIIFEVKHYGLKFVDQIWQSWFSKQPCKSNSIIYFSNNQKKINSISLDKASKYLHGSRSRKQKQLPGKSDECFGFRTRFRFHFHAFSSTKLSMKRNIMH